MKESARCGANSCGHKQKMGSLSHVKEKGDLQRKGDEARGESGTFLMGEPRNVGGWVRPSSGEEENETGEA